MKTTTPLDNGKYEIHQDNGVMWATRNGEKLRDLSGDNLVYHLLMSHLDCECLIGEMKDMLAEVLHNMEVGNSDHTEINDAMIPRVSALLAKARGES
ncbi:hypothetical protein NVP1158O_49 [Vibrio phage 1.158.O._10N.261.45.E12]|nr:hypothetical protein NVP1158O_49 [Vibrio phage 1.158.O._10N.261.45.E12]AUR92678.1 hypothetical protein NVP1175O_50 [Vibrio phage 1.175.O._10N.261.55.B3]